MKMFTKLLGLCCCLMLFGLSPAFAQPANDEPCGAMPLPLNDNCVNTLGTTVDATASANVPVPGCASFSGADVWYSVTVPASGGVTVETSAGPVGTDSGMALYEGDCNGGLTLIECDDDDGPGNFSRIERTGLTPGATLYYRVWEYGSNAPLEFNICATNVLFATNDEACTSKPIACGEALTDLTFTGATQSVDDECLGTGTGDVWISFVSDGSQSLTIAETSTTNVVVQLYSGGTCNSLTEIGTCSDTPESFIISAAGSYYFRVRPFSTGATYAVSLTCSDFASNDEACTATSLVCGDALTGLSFAGASQSIDDACGGAGVADIWMSFISDGTQVFTIAETSTSDVVVQLYSGTDCSNLTEVSACADGPESFSVGTAGTYYFRVRPYSTATTYAVSLTCIPFAANDEACTATSLVCGDALTGLSFAGATQSIDDACAGSGVNDVWISFVADGTQAITIAETSTSDVVVQLYSGADCNNLTEVSSCSDTPESFSVGTAGTYYFRIRPYSTATTYAVSLTCIPFAANDEACTATSLVCGDALTGLSFAGATQSIDDACAGSGVNDVWFTFVSDGSQALLISETSTSNVVVELYTADDCNTLTPVGSCSDAPEEFAVNNAGTYYFRVRPFSTATTYAVSLTCTEFECPNIPGNIGDPCDDLNPNTTGDAITADCECVGNPIPPNDLCSNALALECGVEYLGTTAFASASAGQAYCGTPAPGLTNGGIWYSYTGSENTSVTVDLSGSSFDTKIYVYTGECESLVCLDGDDDDGDGTTSLITFPASEGVTYSIYVSGFSANRGDVVLNIDCVPIFDCDLLGVNIGDPCDDGDANTDNDVITADCECVGTITYDCPALEANIGESCDDGDANTDNDVITADCECVGTITYDCPALEANIGASCDDGDANTDNDVITADCECVGTITYDCPALEANIGESCDDGDANTDNDVITADCECVGTITYDCPALEANIGESCDDGDANTDNDVITADCECVGTPIIVYDCPALEANIGESCDDGDANTDNDVITADCECVGTPIIVYDCPALEANIGESCDDGDANTDNDVITADCECVGTITYDCPALEANIGESCDDGDANTDNDVITADCECVGTSIEAGCANTSQYPSGTDALNTPDTITVSTCNYFEEYSIMSAIIAGYEYEFTGQENTSGNLGFITVRSDSVDGPVIGAGMSPLSVTAVSSANLYVHWNTDAACGTNNACATTTAACISCATIEDCAGVPGGLALPGTPCDDGDATTYDDTYTEDCDCVGIPYDCLDLLANIGDSCDDLDPTTSGDVVGDNCVCAGTPIVANDDCANAEEIACGATVSSSTSTATNSNFGFPSCAGGAPADVFYTLETEPGTEYTVTVNGADYDGVLIVYSGTCEQDDQIEIDCSDSGFTSGIAETIVFTVDEAQTVIIRTYDWSSSRGNFDLSVSCESAFECPELEANIGDACDDLDADTENDVVTETCECAGTPISEGCQDFVVYLADNLEGEGSSIYEVSFDGIFANLTLIAQYSDEIHIAYNNADNLIYGVSKANNSYVTMNPHIADPVFSSPVNLGGNYGQFSGATFSADGDFLIASQSTKVIYAVDLVTNVVTTYDGNSPVQGGDIASSSNGMIYLASNGESSGLYEAYPSALMSDVFLSTVPPSTTGLAITNDDQLLLSAKGEGTIELRDLDGFTVQSYKTMLNNAEYPLNFGDMTSGCNTYVEPTPGLCNDFSTYLAQLNIEGETDIYEVEFVGSDANLTYVVSVPYEAHIAYNAEDDLLYLGSKTQSYFEVYEPSGSAFMDLVNYSITLNDLTGSVYNPFDGQLYVADAGDDMIYSVDPETGVVSEYGAADVLGGDLGILEDGSLYLASQSGSALYDISNSVSPEFVGVTPSKVTGLARSNNSQGFMVSNYKSMVFTEISADNAGVIASYNVIFNGQPFKLLFGDMASGCGDQGDADARVQTVVSTDAVSVLSSQPNPTSGHSEVYFTTPETVRTLLEVYDMNGRNVATLFNQEAQGGNQYRIDFNGAALPNGVYIYRLTTVNETIIEKFMIAK